VFLMPAPHAFATQRVNKADDRLANDRVSAFALIAASGDDQNFVGLLHLLLPQPGLSVFGGLVRRRSRLAQVERAPGPDARFIKRLPEIPEFDSTL
jgi:hypothetical protein